MLFLADSHLGLDLPLRPRSSRRRRGHDFLANYALALEPALAGAVDLVVHGGDVFNRSRVPPSLAWQALDPLVRIAARGIPVFIVPGNHERSRIPHLRFARHDGVHLFDRPRTFDVEVRGERIALTGFPYERHNVRDRFTELVSRARARPDGVGVTSLLCIHHCVEGATVGPGNYVFRSAPDVIRGQDLPADCAAVLSGHIHRHQVLTHDLRGRRTPSPVLYPGSIERTATAEIGEPKGYLMLDLDTTQAGAAVRWTFHELPTRPMLVRELEVGGPHDRTLQRRLARIFSDVPTDAVLVLRVNGSASAVSTRILSARNLRALAPPTMNVQLRISDPAVWTRTPPARRSPQTTLDLPLG
jgi:exonuclease SbcD